MVLLLMTKLRQIPAESPTRHFLGLPPQLTGGVDHRVPLPQPRILIIDQDPEGFLLLRYSDSGEFGGDTWHSELEDAKQQAEFEYRGFIVGWRPVPEHVTQITDCVSFALANL
jgi:hypothetical protein